MPKEYLRSLEGVILESGWQAEGKHLVFVCKYGSSQGKCLLVSLTM